MRRASLGARQQCPRLVYLVYLSRARHVCTTTRTRPARWGRRQRRSGHTTPFAFERILDRLVRACPDSVPVYAAGPLEQPAAPHVPWDSLPPACLPEAGGLDPTRALFKTQEVCAPSLMAMALQVQVPVTGTHCITGASATPSMLVHMEPSGHGLPSSQLPPQKLPDPSSLSMQ